MKKLLALAILSSFFAINSFAEEMTKDCALLKGAFETSYGLSTAFKMNNVVKSSDVSVVKAITLTERAKAIDTSIGLRNISMLVDNNKAKKILFDIATNIINTKEDANGDKLSWMKLRDTNNAVFDNSYNMLKSIKMEICEEDDDM